MGNLKDLLKQIKLKTILVLIFYFILGSSLFINQKIFSLGINNLVPVRLFLIGFVFLAIPFLIFKLKVTIKDVINVIDYRTVLGQINILMGGLLIFRLLSGFWAIDKRDWMNMNFYWLIIFVFFILTTILVQKKIIQKKDLFLGLKIWYIMALCSIIFGLFQLLIFVGLNYKLASIWAFGYPNLFRITGFTNDPNHLSIIAIWVIFFSIYYYLISQKWAYLLNIFVASLGFFLTGSKTGMLALIVSLIFFFLFWLVKKSFNLKQMIVIVLLMLSGFIGYQGVVVITNKICTPNSHECPWLKKDQGEDFKKTEATASATATPSASKKQTANRVFDYQNEQGSVKAHLFLLLASYNIMLSNPLLGVGYGNFAETLKSNSGLNSLFRSIDPAVAKLSDYPSHTAWGEILAETGILGFLFYTLLIYAILELFVKKLVNNHQKENEILIITLILLLISVQVFRLFFALNEEFVWLIMTIGILLNINYLEKND